MEFIAPEDRTEYNKTRRAADEDAGKEGYANYISEEGYPVDKPKMDSAPISEAKSLIASLQGLLGGEEKKEKPVESEFSSKGAIPLIRNSGSYNAKPADSVKDILNGEKTSEPTIYIIRS